MHLESKPPYTSSEGEVPATSVRTKRWPARLYLVSLLTVHVVLLGYNAAWMSPTLDEPAHLVSGISHWRYGDFSLYRVNPPLVRMVAAIPVMLAGYKFDFPDLSRLSRGRHEFRLGEEFVHANGRRTLWLTTIARWACIPFSLLGALVCYLWSRDLYGRNSGMLAITLWCFSPMVLGHAALFTPDAHAAALGLLACYTFWLWLKAPCWRLTVFAGLILGLTELAKTTMILLFPIWPILWLVDRLTRSTPFVCKQWCDQGAMLALRMVIGLFVLNLGYLGEGSFMQLKNHSFSSSMFTGDSVFTQYRDSAVVANRFCGTWIENMPVPLPYDYIVGIDFQQRDFEDFGRPSYLRGQFQEKGWWYYYLYAALVKTPLGVLVLIGITISMRASGAVVAIPWRDEMALLAPAATIFIIVSLKTGFSHHYRYIFPCIPAIIVWTSQAAQVNYSCFFGGARKILWALPVTFSVVIAIGSSIWRFPHSLAYFNEAVGGPRNGAEHLLNSNIDWSQDLLHLERWIQETAGDEVVFLAFDGYLNPFDITIDRITPWPFRRVSDSIQADQQSPVEVVNGFYAISVNQLYEFPWPLRDADGERYFIDTRPLRELRKKTPIGRAGYSVRIYSATQLREAYSMKDHWSGH